MPNIQLPYGMSWRSLRLMIGGALLLFSAVMAVILALQGNRPLLVAVTVLPFAICGLVCLLVKKLTLLWCGWAFFLSLGLSHFDPVGQLLWPGFVPFFLALALALYTAWILRNRLWGSPKRRLWGELWLCGVAALFLMRWVIADFYNIAIPIPEFCTQEEILYFQFRHSLAVVLSRVSGILVLVLAAVALSALFYFGSTLLRKRRSKSKQ